MPFRTLRRAVRRIPTLSTRKSHTVASFEQPQRKMIVARKQGVHTRDSYSITFLMPNLSEKTVGARRPNFGGKHRDYW